MTERNSEHPIDDAFLSRWSPRAFDGSTIDEADLFTIMEAGRWAPSASNYQPWRFLYARRGDAFWGDAMSLLIPFNQGWAHSASALVFIVSDELTRGPKGDAPNHSHSFDCGTAWGFMAMQALQMGFYTHGMTGLEFDKAPGTLNLPANFRLEAAFVIGRRGSPEILPDGLRERETPNQRRPLAESVINGPMTPVG